MSIAFDDVMFILPKRAETFALNILAQPSFKTAGTPQDLRQDDSYLSECGIDDPHGTTESDPTLVNGTPPLYRNRYYVDPLKGA